MSVQGAGGQQGSALDQTTVETRGGERGLTLKFKRNDVVTLLWSLESVIEDAKYDGGLLNVPDELRLAQRLRERLHQHDLGPASARPQGASRKDNRVG